MTARELRCTAGHVVGVVVGPPHAGIVAIQHQGREVIAYGIVCIRCGCGAVYKPDAPRGVLDDLEYKASTVSVR